MILLTGHRGYIGKLLHVALEAEGYEVVGFNCSNSMHRHWDFEFGRWFRRDIDYEAVIHCGAIAGSQSTDPSILELNTAATDSLLSAFQGREDNPYFIFFSSGLVYESSSLYAYSKRLAESFVRAKSDNYLIMRVFNVFGGAEPLNRQSVVTKLMNGTLEHLFTNWVRDYIHVDEVCRDVLFMLKYRPKNETIDVGTAVPTNLGMLGHVIDRSVPHSDPKTVLKVPAPQRMVAKVDRMRYFPKTNLIDYLKEKGYEGADEIRKETDG